MLRCFKNRCTTEKRQQLQRNFFFGNKKFLLFNYIWGSKTLKFKSLFSLSLYNDFSNTLTN